MAIKLTVGTKYKLQKAVKSYKDTSLSTVTGQYTKDSIVQITSIDIAKKYINISYIKGGTAPFGTNSGIIKYDESAFGEVVTDKTVSANKNSSSSTKTSTPKTKSEQSKNNDKSSSKNDSIAAIAANDTPSEEFLAALGENANVFQEEYSVTYGSDDEYLQNLGDGLQIKDFRGIFGAPHQFLPSADPRIDGTNNNDAIGRIYATKILENVPLLLITPGTPVYMSKYTKKQRETVIQYYINKYSVAESAISKLVDNGGGKYYSLRYNYTAYFEYVNAMLRSAAFYLKIDKEKIDGVELGEYNWLYSNNGNIKISKNGNTDIWGHEGMFKYLGPHAGTLPFYVNAETSISDSFSNNTTQPSIASTASSLSEKGKELNFLLGNISGFTGLGFDKFTQDSSDGSSLADSVENVQSMVNKILGSGTSSIVNRITGAAQTLIAGGKMIFPDIWESSDYSRSYSVSMKLVSPSGDKLSVYLNILVPIYHLLGLCLPRASTTDGYFSPFLIRCYYKGLFNIDMGIITDLTVTKGTDGEWTVDGLPTVAEISITIKDLYTNLTMSKGGIGNTEILKNVSELDYIANSCGVNVNEPDVRRNIEMYLALGIVNKVRDKITIGIFGKAAQWFNNKISNIFGKF